jgi:hypothetical protein
MLPNQVAVGLDLGSAFLFEASFDIDPGCEHDDRLFVHRRVGLDSKVGQAHLGFEVEIVA